MTRRFTRGRPGSAAALWLAVWLAAAGAASCDKMPLSAPTDSTITLYASSTTIGLNSSIEITATVIESGGTPVQNGTVVTFTTTLGTIEPSEARTSNGKVTVRLVAGTKSGTADVRAFSGGTSSGDALQITVGAAAVAKVDLLANPSTLPSSGGTVQLTAVVTDAAGNRVGGVTVVFTSDAGLLAQTSLTTDPNGEARTALTTTIAANVTASVPGGAGEGASAKLSIPVKVQPTVSISPPAGSLVPGVPATFGVSVKKGDAPVKSATVHFGDGASLPVGTDGLSTVTHTYFASGNYTVSAVVTDTVGETATALSTVTVQDLIVTVSLTVTPATITTTIPAEFAAAATVTPAGAAILRYEWDFGDGSARTTSSPTTNHLYASGGGRRYIVSVRAVTTSGASGSAQREIIVQ